jgi:hypothetical protein
MSKPSIKQRWTPWQLAEHSAQDVGEQVVRNKTHTVFIKPMNADTTTGNPMDGWVTLSIKRNDREAECDWRVFMRIKNELVGPDREAIQVFPSMSRVVDTANQYFLFVAPRGYLLGVGFIDRLVLDEAASAAANEQIGFGGSPKQRDFDEDCPLGKIVGIDPHPMTKREGVFPIPLYPEQVLELMRTGRAYAASETNRSNDGKDESSAGRDAAVV